MLSKREKFVLKAVIDGCGEKRSCLLSATDILCRVPQGAGISEKKLSDILQCLEFDGYIDVILSDRRGEIVYCITPSVKGKGYKRESAQTARYVIYRGLIAVLSALITFAVGRILLHIIN